MVCWTKQAKPYLLCTCLAKPTCTGLGNAKWKPLGLGKTCELRGTLHGERRT